MEKNNKKITYIIVGVLTFAIVGLSIAFAAMSTTLNVTFGTVTQDALTWDVHFKSQTYTGTASGTSDTTGRSCGNVTIGSDGLTATVAETHLSKPKDKCTWTLVAENAGSIDANLSAITVKAPTGTNVTCSPAASSHTSGTTITCGNIKYSLYSSGTTALATGATLAKKSGSTNGTMNVILVAEYLDNTTMSNSSAAITQSGAEFKLTFSQK